LFAGFSTGGLVSAPVTARRASLSTVTVLAVFGLACSSNGQADHGGSGGAPASTGGSGGGTGGVRAESGGATASSGGATTSTGGVTGSGGITSTGGVALSSGGVTAGSGGNNTSSGGAAVSTGGVGGKPAGRGGAAGGAMNAGGADGSNDPNDPLNKRVSCSSGKRSSGAPSENMSPGRACLDCHSFAVAGTIYPTGHETNDCQGLNDPQVMLVITDANGDSATLPINSVGNFAASGELPLPFTAKIVRGNAERRMRTPQTNTDCNECHTAEGANGAPGRLVPPL
jgi:hypothetical protein